MSGTASVPNTFATSAGQVAASKLDDNNTAITGYINDREVMSGTHASRPAAGVSGRWYFSNDLNGGTLWFDTGSSWLQAAAPAEVSGGFRVLGLLGVPNAANPLTQYEISATQVILWRTTGSTITRVNTGTIVNNTSTSGPTANGRDQAAAFSANSWVHFYFIWNGTTLASISSVNTQDVGPTLPSGYTHWAYATAIRFNASAQMDQHWTSGAWVTRCVPIGGAALTNGTATSFTTVSLAALVAPNSTSARIHTQINGTMSGNATVYVSLRTLGSSQEIPVAALTTTSAQTVLEVSDTTMHINSQQIQYKTNAPLTSGGVNLDVTAYKVPNGGE